MSRIVPAKLTPILSHPPPYRCADCYADQHRHSAGECSAGSCRARPGGYMRLLTRSIGTEGSVEALAHSTRVVTVPAHSRKG